MTFLQFFPVMSLGKILPEILFILFHSDPMVTFFCIKRMGSLTSPWMRIVNFILFCYCLVFWMREGFTFKVCFSKGTLRFLFTQAPWEICWLLDPCSTKYPSFDPVSQVRILSFGRLFLYLGRLLIYWSFVFPCLDNSLICLWLDALIQSGYVFLWIMISFLHFFSLVFWFYIYPVKGILCISFLL